jgi:hypothetical protein
MMQFMLDGATPAAIVVHALTNESFHFQLYPDEVTRLLLVLPKQQSFRLHDVIPHFLNHV